jgi:hypothetical protein
LSAFIFSATTNLVAIEKYKQQSLIKDMSISVFAIQKDDIHYAVWVYDDMVCFQDALWALTHKAAPPTALIMAPLPQDVKARVKRTSCGISEHQRHEGGPLWCLPIDIPTIVMGIERNRIKPGASNFGGKQAPTDSPWALANLADFNAKFRAHHADKAVKQFAQLLSLFADDDSLYNAAICHNSDVRIALSGVRRKRARVEKRRSATNRQEEAPDVEAVDDGESGSWSAEADMVKD